MGRLPKSYFVKAEELFNHIPKSEYHIHTSYTDGDNSIEELIKESICIGLKQIIFTEHIEPWFAKKENWFASYEKEIRFFQVKYKNTIDIKVGIEAPAIDFLGNIDITEEMDKKCDYILGAAHRYPGLEGRKVGSLSEEEAIELEYKTLMGLAQNKSIDAIAHIGGTCSKYCTKFPRRMMVDIIKLATKNGIAIEINNQYHNPIKDIIDICVKEKAFIVLGSNVHVLSQVGAVYNTLINYNEVSK